MTARLIIICGLPGSGKSTHASALEKSLNAVRFSADDWMNALGINLWDEAARAKVEALQWTCAQRSLELGQTVLIEWGTWARSERDELRERAADLGAKVELHYLTASLDVLFDRLNERGIEDPPITRSDLKKYAAELQSPDDPEAELYDRFVVITPQNPGV